MKRIAAKLIVLPLLGAIVNVAVAWGIVAFEQVRQRSSTRVSGANTTGYRIIGSGPESNITFLNQLRQPPIGYGWPMQAVSMIPSGFNTNSLHRRWPINPGDQALKLPTTPIWPGLAINTIFYAGILGMLWFGPGAVRRMIRRRRGRCPACAYPVGTSPICSECGASIPSPLRERARVRVGRNNKGERA